MPDKSHFLSWQNQGQIGRLFLCQFNHDIKQGRAVKLPLVVSLLLSKVKQFQSPYKSCSLCNQSKLFNLSLGCSSTKNGRNFFFSC